MNIALKVILTPETYHILLDFTSRPSVIRTAKEKVVINDLKCLVLCLKDKPGVFKIFVLCYINAINLVHVHVLL